VSHFSIGGGGDLPLCMCRRNWSSLPLSVTQRDRSVLWLVARYVLGCLFAILFGVFMFRYGSAELILCHLSSACSLGLLALGSLGVVLAASSVQQKMGAIPVPLIILGML
jgi:hypothetical protein